MTAPSFSSFPPSFSSFPNLDPGPSQHQHRDTSRSRLRVLKKDKHEDRNRKAGKHKDKKKHHEGSHNRETLLGEPLRYEETSKLLFYSDRKGDPLNVSYGGLYAGDIPKYSLVAHGRKILGLSSAWVAFYRSHKGVEVGLEGHHKIADLTHSKYRVLLSTPPKRRIITGRDSYKYKEIGGFLRLPSGKGRTEKRSYRSISNPNDSVDSDSGSSSESDLESTDEDRSMEMSLPSLQAKIKALEEVLASDPSSVSTWLSLLFHSLSTVPPNSKHASVARSEIAISILSRAINADPSNMSSAILRIKYLKAGEDIWLENKLWTEWEDALRLNRPGLWMEWLEWRIRKGSRGINGVVEDSRRILDALGTNEAAEVTRVRVLWRVAVVLRDAGYPERATAMFQAQSELTFGIPHDLYGLPLSNLLNGLEEFWDSEVSRIGEPGSTGWAAWVSAGKPEDQSQPPSTVHSLAIPQPLEDSDLYNRWSLQELATDRKSFLPSRSTDNSAESDPYATILFSDIRPLLISLRNAKAKHAFRLAWLCFLGLHIPGFTPSLTNEDEFDVNWDDRWSYTHLTRPPYLTTLFPSLDTRKRLTAHAVAGVLVGDEKEYASSFGPMKFWGYGVIGPLETVGLPGKEKDRGCLWTKADVDDLDVEFIRRIFKQLKLGPDDLEWDTLALAFEVACNTKRAISTSRLFLSEAQDSLLLWAAHAKLERLRGRRDDARKVYSTVLVASSPSELRPEIAQLWWDWAELEWMTGTEESTLQVILKAVDIAGHTGINILRAKRALEGAVKRVDSSRNTQAWIQLRALLELCTGGGLDAALSIFDEHLQSTMPGCLLHEGLTVASLLLIYRHAAVLKRSTPPSLLREWSSKALDHYPSNSMVLGMFLEGEKGQGVWGRVRSIIGDVGVGRDRDREKDLARRVEEVWITSWECGRWEREIERTRNGLSEAVEHERTRGSPILWRIYIELEIHAGQLDRAKRLLFRALGECPLIKELYLLAFGPLRKVFSTRELNSFADTMAEREIRMRVGLDEVLRGLKEEEDTSEDDGSEDEISQDAQERRRLMPY